MPLLAGGDLAPEQGDPAGQPDDGRQDDEQRESESRQDSATMATTVATAVVRFEAIEVVGPEIC